jgi:hypothetical protein
LYTEGIYPRNDPPKPLHTEGIYPRSDPTKGASIFYTGYADPIPATSGSVRPRDEYNSANTPISSFIDSERSFFSNPDVVGTHSSRQYYDGGSDYLESFSDPPVIVDATAAASNTDTPNSKHIESSEQPKPQFGIPHVGTRTVETDWDRIGTKEEHIGGDQSHSEPNSSRRIEKSHSQNSGKYQLYKSDSESDLQPSADSESDSPTSISTIYSTLFGSDSRKDKSYSTNHIDAEYDSKFKRSKNYKFANDESSDKYDTEGFDSSEAIFETLYSDDDDDDSYDSSSSSSSSTSIQPITATAHDSVPFQSSHLQSQFNPYYHRIFPVFLSPPGRDIDRKIPAPIAKSSYYNGHRFLLLLFSEQQHVAFP